MSLPFQSRVRSVLFVVIASLVASTTALASGAWKAVPGGLSVARGRPMMVELLDGRIVVVGGIDPDAGATTTDIYDPATKSWSEGGSFRFGRSDATLVRLRDGRVLLSGGLHGGGGPIPVTDIYDPATNAWTTIPARFGEPDVQSAGAVTLADGRVLVAGGFIHYYPDPAVAVATAFDPATDTWTHVAPMRAPRALHSLVSLADGRVLAVGGYSGYTIIGDSTALVAQTSAEIYDPATNAWTPAAPTSVGHAGALATRLQDGRVLIAGGYANGAAPAITTVEIYDPATNVWTPAPPLTAPRPRPMGGLMFDGRVIVLSADAHSGEVSGEEYIPGAAAWTPIAPASITTPNPSAIVFDGGQYILVAGGNSVDAAEMYKLNHRPLAVATIANPAVQTVPGNLAAINVSAAGSGDLDGDPLTYTWSAGSAILARTNDPTLSATLGLGIGTHTITLTASDVFGETSTATATATVVDGTAGLGALVASLTEQLERSQLRSRVCEATIAAADTAVELAWRLQFRDAAFKLPGASPALKLGGFVAATLTAPTTCQQAEYRTLGGKK
jgi:hypothetical protein